VPLFRRRERPAEPVAPTGPADRDEVARRLIQAAPTVGRQLADSLLPAVRYASRRCPDAAMDIGDTKVGGAPDLPQGTPWPMWTKPDGERRPLQFFAQVNLAEAAAVAPAPLGLPTEGQLSFFADFDLPGEGIKGLHPSERDASTVLYSLPGMLMVRCSPRIRPLPSGDLRPVGVWTWPSEPPDGVDLPDEEFDALDAVDQAAEAELRAQLPEGWLAAGRHQLGGHARPIQHPVEEEVVQALAGCFAGAAKFDHTAWERARPQVAEWRILLQLDSDDTLEVMWGDAGTLWWAARHEDIAAGNWAAGMFNFQCS
jgi:uncharacterized protein YwqG